MPSERGPRRRRFAYAGAAVAYAVLAHGGDLWLTQRGWYLWGVSLRLGNGFNLYEFAAWFVVPLLVSVPALEPGYFSFARWRKLDYALLGAAALAAGVVWGALRWWPAVRGYYGGAAAPLSWYLWWYASWLVGWEFLHRYALTRALARTEIPLIWLLVPVIETGYHALADKPAAEILGMAAFSLAATGWTVWRKNVTLPFIVHAAVEVTLLAYLFTR